MTRLLRSRVLSAAALTAVAALVLAACAATTGADVGEEGTESTSGTVSAEEPTGELAIYAAASLREAFDDLAGAFEERYPNVDVVPVVYDGSSVLATQIIEGAPADVFASANEATMQLVVDEGLIAVPELFATNTLVIAVPTGNPAGITDLADLVGATTVICAVEVPCGAASKVLLDNAGISLTPASLEQNVTAVLAKVETGEADAGLVYATDASTTDAVTAIVPEGADEVVNKYPIGAVEGAANPVAADAFVEFTLGEAGQQLLSEFGFGAAP